MKKILLIGICIISTTIYGHGQNQLDTVVLKNAVADSSSQNGYNALLKKFNEYPEFLYPDEGRIVYYGKLYDGIYSPFNSLFTNNKLAELASKKQFIEAINEGERLLENNPTSLKVLLILLQCYLNTSSENKLKLTRNKLILLQNAILSIGKGDSEENTIKITSVEDEYVLLNTLGVKPDSKKVKSKNRGNSILDIWKIKKTETGQDAVFFEVLYAYR